MKAKIVQDNLPFKAKSRDLATDDHKGTSVPHHVTILQMRILLMTLLPVEFGTQPLP